MPMVVFAAILLFVAASGLSVISSIAAGVTAVEDWLHNISAKTDALSHTD
jgi:hypothetical protein